MPFDPPFARALTRPGVIAYAPEQSGVYGISNAREWIYIGESDNIRASLLNYLSGAGTSRATGFAFELCAPNLRFARQDRLVFEYEPVQNRRERR
jgi:hypothetical protein